MWKIPLGMMVVVTGVSGSGKSTLVHDVMFRSLEALHKARESDHDPEFDNAAEALEHQAAQISCKRVEGAERILSTVMVDQSPIGRTPRSNPVTYLKAFDIIRGLFASTREGVEAGLHPGALLVQRAGRPLRDLPGRWHGYRRDAIPGGRGVDLR